MKFRVNSIFGHYYEDITLDSPRSDIETVFSAGNCHSFALAVNKLTGWPLHACFRQEDEDEIASHVFVRTPNGDYFDITGVKTPEKFTRRWRGDIRPIKKWHIRSWCRQFRETQCGYIPVRVKDSMPFAQRLLTSWGFKFKPVALFEEIEEEVNV